jgi:hypothetical protein
MAYTTHTLIRSLEEAFSDTTDFPNATLEGWATNFGDPEIDGRLEAAGFTTPVAAPQPALIKAISTMLAAAHGLDSFVGQFTGREVERAAKLRERARKYLDEIADGSTDVGLTRSDESRPIDVDDDPETFGAREAVVGNEESWKRYTEDRP